MIAAGLTIIFSLFLWFSGQADAAIFVGLWVPSILILSLIFKKAAVEAKAVVEDVAKTPPPNTPAV